LLKIEKHPITFFVLAAAWAFIFCQPWHRSKKNESERRTSKKKLHPANSHTQNSQNHLFIKFTFLLLRILIVFKQCRLI